MLDDGTAVAWVTPSQIRRYNESLVHIYDAFLLSLSLSPKSLYRYTHVSKYVRNLLNDVLSYRFRESHCSPYSKNIYTRRTRIFSPIVIGRAPALCKFTTNTVALVFKVICRSDATASVNKGDVIASCWQRRPIVNEASDVRDCKQARVRAKFLLSHSIPLSLSLSSSFSVWLLLHVCTYIRTYIRIHVDRENKSFWRLIWSRKQLFPWEKHINIIMTYSSDNFLNKKTYLINVLINCIF